MILLNVIAFLLNIKIKHEHQAIILRLGEIIINKNGFFNNHVEYFFHYTLLQAANHRAVQMYPC